MCLVTNSEPLVQMGNAGELAPVIVQQPPDPPQVVHLPDPAETLARSQQRFPNVPVAVLMGTSPIIDRSEDLNTLLEQIRAQAPTPGHVPVLVGEGDQARVALMPTTGVSGPNPPEKIQACVIAGKAVFDRVMAGTYAGPTNKADMTHLMWYLQALGSAKSSLSSGGGQVPGMYREGALSVEDPQGHLEAFLNGANSYSRSSSHMKHYQDLGPGFKPRGVDIRNTETPNGRKTILFARMPKDDETGPNGPPGTGDKRMLFIKMESHGCRGISFKGGVSREGTTISESFKRFFSNIGDWFGHAFGFVRSQGQQAGAVALAGQNNRERIPADVKTSWTALTNAVKAAPIGDEHRERLLSRLNNKSPLDDGSGIKQMLLNIGQTIPYIDAPERSGVPGLAALKASLAGVRQSLQTHGDHPELRIGNEVILTQEEMNTGSVSPIKPYNGEGELKAQGSLSPRAQEIMLAGYQYKLDNIGDEPNEQFRVDANRSVYRIDEQVFVRDQAGSVNAVLAMTDGNQRIANALMAITHQEFAADIEALMTNHSMNTAGVIVSSNTQGSFEISRVRDVPAGEQVYIISYQNDFHPNSVPPNIPLDPRSTVSGINSLRIIVHNDGSMTPEVVVPPSFSYTLIPLDPPQPPQQ